MHVYAYIHYMYIYMYVSEYIINVCMTRKSFERPSKILTKFFNFSLTKKCYKYKFIAQMNYVQIYVCIYIHTYVHL